VGKEIDYNICPAKINILKAKVIIDNGGYCYFGSTLVRAPGLTPTQFLSINEGYFV
jgi:hypothetical protein